LGKGCGAKTKRERGVWGYSCWKIMKNKDIIEQF
jgi:hypothetical protein